MLVKMRKVVGASFFEKMSDKQLVIEGCKLLKKIERQCDYYTRFEKTDFEDLLSVKNEVEFLIDAVKTNAIDELLYDTSEKTRDYHFKKLATQNNWNDKQMRLIEDFDHVLIEMLVRKGLIYRYKQR